MAIFDINRLRTDANPATIRSIRTQLIGKQIAKQSAIRAGILPVLSRLLVESEDNLYLEAAYLVSVLAREGPSYVQPILKSDIPAILLQHLVRDPAPRDQLAVLKCLNAIAAELPSSDQGQWQQDSTLAQLLFSRPYITYFISGIKSTSDTLISSQISDLTISLLCKTCKREAHKRALTELGILHVLAQRLAAFIVAEGLVSPSLEALDFPHNAASTLPDPAPKKAHLSPILEAIVLFFEHSKQRAEQFLVDPALEAIFPRSKDQFTPGSLRQTPWGGNSAARSQTRHAIDGLLPTIPTKARAGSVSNINFPPLGGGPLQRRRSSFHPNPPSASNIAFTTDDRGDEDEKGLIPILLFFARESRGKRRLLACKLLAILHDLELVSKTRSRTFGPLLVPILVRMLDVDDPPASENTAGAGSYMANGIHYSRIVPHVLGLLLVDDSEFQRAAVDANAITMLSTSLKKSFQTLNPIRKKAPWRPYKDEEVEFEPKPADCVVGGFGPFQDVRHMMMHREGILQALAAIAPFNDDYRKQICDQGNLVEIMLAMEPYQSRTSERGHCQVVGNPASTILAACGCIRALTRSVTALRTKLVDAEVANSVIRLMSNPDPEVRIAATKVLANLAMDFSPMKASVGESAVVKKLCEQAHSANARLRLESLWALKQLAVNASKELKIQIVDELGSSWIRQLISTDPYDIPEGEVIGLIVDKEYPPRLLATEDIVMSEDSGDEQVDDFEDASSHPVEPIDDFNRHTPEDDCASQEQVLDLLRNLFCGDTASDLVDHVLGEIGKSEFFDILRKRLTGRRTIGATRKDNVDIPQSAGIISKVLYIVVHIAACGQTWREAVTSETTLLKMIVGFHNHSEREVRVQLCWLAINLLFEDGVTDNFYCQRRAVELFKCGYREKITKLEGDPDLDVRERAKTAIHLFNTLLRN